MSIRTLASIGIAGPLLFATLVLLQDLLQYDYLVANGDDPWTTSPVSVNALGPYGWIQILNFAAIGLSVLALAIAAHRGIHGPNQSRAGPALIALWGLAWLLAMFPIERVPHSLSGTLHGISFVALSLLAIPMFLLTWRRLGRSPGWEGFARYTLAMGLLTLPLEAASIALQDIAPFSWFYVWVLALLLWCVLLGLRLLRVDERADWPPSRLTLRY